MFVFATSNTVPIPDGSNLLESAWETAKGIFQSSTPEQYASELSYIEILLALTVASLLGAVIAYHPNRHMESTGPVSDKELKNTQILLCVAGAIMVALIQGSIERAFGLVGLGSFVRYRTTLRNPVDLSIILILIGLGMACGLQLYEFAITMTGFMYILLYLLEVRLGRKQTVWMLKVDTNEPTRVERAFREIAAQQKYRILRLRADAGGSNLRCRFISRKAVDTEALTDLIQEKSGEGVHFARFQWEQESE
jgi:uncharacterized membrane protein YhiD involved in acid resistance